MIALDELGASAYCFGGRVNRALRVRPCSLLQTCLNLPTSRVDSVWHRPYYTHTEGIRAHAHTSARLACTHTHTERDLHRSVTSNNNVYRRKHIRDSNEHTRLLFRSVSPSHSPTHSQTHILIQTHTHYIHTHTHTHTHTDTHTYTVIHTERHTTNSYQGRKAASSLTHTY